MNEPILFTAPWDFLDLSPFESSFEIEKRVVWRRSELSSSDALAWIPNPGQNFVIDDETLDLLPNLEVIVTPSTGTNHVDVSSCARRGISFFSLLDAPAAMESISASAEFTFLHILNATRRFDRALREAERGAWRSREELLRGRELQDRRVGLIGFGRIGRRLARYLAAFDASVAVYDPYVIAPAEVTQYANLRDLFNHSEVVVVCCRLTPETEGMVSDDLVALLPQDGVLVNTSRGEILDESSICRLLERRRDITLAVDVLEGEVRDEHHSSCLWDVREPDRVIITPHVAGASVDSQRKAALAALSLVDDFLRDRPHR